jgi:hypothetical protein
MIYRTHHFGSTPLPNATPRRAQTQRGMPGRALRIATAALVLGYVALAGAQNKAPDRKLFCWNENGRKVCSDSLPASAVDRQRVEINQTSGTAVRTIDRALTETEREQQAAAAKAAEGQEARLRREMAMVQTFSTEADLERSFRNRFELLDASLKSSALAIKNLRQSLLTMLRQANDSELENKPVGKRTVEKLRTQQQELRQLTTMQQRQTQERAELDVQFQSALLRYRELKKQMSDGAPQSAAIQPSRTGG